MLRCILDVACLGGVLISAFGWLPIAVSLIASTLAAIHYSIVLHDRFRGKSHE